MVAKMAPSKQKLQQDFKEGETMSGIYWLLFFQSFEQVSEMI